MQLFPPLGSVSQVQVPWRSRLETGRAKRTLVTVTPEGLRLRRWGGQAEIFAGSRCSAAKGNVAVFEGIVAVSAVFVYCTRLVAQDRKLSMAW